MCKCYFKTIKLNISCEKYGVGNTVLKCSRGQSQVLATNTIDNCHVCLLDFPVKMLDENPSYYPSAEVFFSSRI